ncbi:MAG: alpha/beta fold hydrolase [Anaerolineae bacterium]|nr:alpha/beta fold hydrolase [Thermoflexales bacterium]MDW8406889.1 alpha/beta fold hydrolase [Anaerolineae bacterium]
MHSVRPPATARLAVVLAVTVWLLLSACAAPSEPAPSAPTPVPTGTPKVTAPPGVLASPTHPAPTPPTTSQPANAPQSATRSPSSITATLAQLGATPCPTSAFLCITLDMPLDHAAPAGDSAAIGAAIRAATIPVVFGVLPASGIRKGMLMVAVGGPGVAGLRLADRYAAAYSPRIREHFDLVFFDPRGTGMSRAVECPQAAVAYHMAAQYSTSSAVRPELIADAQTFVRSCVEESSAGALLAFLNTRQIAADLERFRQIVAVEQMWLYGESYGTHVAQAYAALYPAHVAGLILDAPIDPTDTLIDYAGTSALAFEDVLSQTLAACDADARCAGDVDGNASDTYDRLLAAFARGPIVFEFPLRSGELVARTLRRSDVDTAVASYLSAPDARVLMLRAVAAARQGDLVPLARLFYSALSLDPDTMRPGRNPAYSDAAYYAVTCADHAKEGSGDTSARLEMWMQAGRDLLARAPRLGAVFYGDLPCVFWPTIDQRQPRLNPLIPAGIPMLVLAASADPLTPLAIGERLHRRLENSYLIATQGGAHVMFGRGNRCVDNAVTRFLVEAIPPSQRETVCQDKWIDGYVPIAPTDVTRFTDVLESMHSLNNEIEHLPEYFYWDGSQKTVVGCARGGWVSFELRSERVAFVLEGCSFSRGLTFTGVGEYDFGTERFSLIGRADGVAQGRLAYTREADGSAYVSGTYAGQSVDIGR